MAQPPVAPERQKKKFFYLPTFIPTKAKTGTICSPSALILSWWGWYPSSAVRRTAFVMTPGQRIRSAIGVSTNDTLVVL